MWKQLTQTARRLVIRAQQEATRDGSLELHANHLLRAALELPDPVTLEVLVRAGVEPDSLLAELVADGVPANGQPAELPSGRDCQFDHAAKLALTGAFNEAERRRHDPVGTDHLLVGVASCGDPVVDQALAAVGVSVEQLRQAAWPNGEDAGSAVVTAPTEAEGSRRMKVICLDGEFVAPDQAKVSVFDHGLLYGDGVFEGIRAYAGRVFLLEQHIRRLYDSARVIMLQMPLEPDAFASQIVETCRRNEIVDGYIRAVVTRGPGDLGLDPRKCPKASYFIIADSIVLYPERCYTEGLKVITCATRRNAPTALDPAVKSLNYLNNILAKIEVNRAGADEGLMLNQQGFVAEATGDNIFLIRDGEIFTPPLAAGVLPGITRNAVVRLARDQGLTVREEFFTTQFVYSAEECFLTGTAAEVVPVVEVDDRTIGSGRPGPITWKLIKGFRELAASCGTPIR